MFSVGNSLYYSESIDQQRADFRLPQRTPTLSHGDIVDLAVLPSDYTEYYYTTGEELYHGFDLFATPVPVPLAFSKRIDQLNFIGRGD